MRARDRERINDTIAHYMKHDKPLGLLMDELMDRFELSQTQAEDAVHTWQDNQEHKHSVNRAINYALGERAA